MHLGEDWNGQGGGSTDFGDPVYAISDGVVLSAGHMGEGMGWGNVINIVHYNKHLNTKYVESVYAHLNEMYVQFGQPIKKGDLIGTIGDADGKYSAHLHLEIRNQIRMPLGSGYGNNEAGYYVKPTEFINRYRTLRKH